MHENPRGGQAFISTRGPSEIPHAGIEKISQHSGRLAKNRKGKKGFWARFVVREIEHFQRYPRHLKRIMFRSASQRRMQKMKRITLVAADEAYNILSVT